ncbi:uncharacterized protein SCHCODRAFT_02502968 [Schizophyllum commune H4-8]|uniref:Uncharacterized protein n=1 Tax=Schizophyllum commune (strain H4-8 / FGSC 9210) TaxID=578458 RepID=D8Q3X4_SCHCM|nr:uncharacterized protein SCHCODRAFT_02502968 [Schizophyllum commune H4-8]KAI5892851.1 hypothetical protein SCHCODRAFT_02502968 [Schizophyllum commune H4-8]
MKFSTVATIVVLSLAGFSGAMPARGENAPAVRAENAREIHPTPATASPTTPETNAQRLSRGLPPLKPRSMGATHTEVKRQGPSGMRRRAPVRANLNSKRDRYAGVYGA